MITFARIRPHLSNFPLYIMGAGGLYLADFLIAGRTTHVIVAQWAILKTVMMIAGSLSLFGLDQVLVREPKASRVVGGVALVTTALGALLTGALVTYAQLGVGFVAAAVAVFGFAVSTLLAARARAYLMFSQSLLAANGWKILFAAALLAIPASAGHPAIILGISMALSVGFSAWIARGPAPQTLQHHHDVVDYPSAFRIGLPYLLAAASLSIASYGESLVVRVLGDTAILAHYFRCTLLFLSPAVALNAYVAVFIGPSLRNNPIASMRRAKFYVGASAAAGILAALGALTIGYIGLALLPDWRAPISLAVVLSLTAGVRFSYIVLGGFVGVLAPARMLNRATQLYLLFALAMPALAGLLHWTGLDILTAVALANLFNWAFRTLTAGWISISLSAGKEVAP